MDNLSKIRDDNGKLPAFAWPGGYPIYYLAADNGVLCPKCANDYTAERDNEKELKPVAYDIHWEGEPLACDNCPAKIESAYGVPDESK